MAHTNDQERDAWSFGPKRASRKGKAFHAGLGCLNGGGAVRMFVQTVHMPVAAPRHACELRVKRQSGHFGSQARRVLSHVTSCGRRHSAISLFSFQLASVIKFHNGSYKPTAVTAAAEGTEAAPTTPQSDRFQRVIAKIDEANTCDPNKVEVEGIQFPYELVYSKWVTGWVSRLSPNPSEELLIAAHGQHICRWEVPRSSYPEGRTGYLKWREGMKLMHSQKVGEFMAAEGYSDSQVQRVKDVMLKKSLRDEETQVLEDALCLVFFERQYAGVQAALPADKLAGVVAKTWAKMSVRGRAAAAQLPLQLPLPADETK